MAIAKLDEEKAKNVVRQVEFYFSDSNLPRDNFLQKSIQQSDDGLVSLALICSFARMRMHLGLGSIKPDEVSDETVSAVAEALRTSPLLKLSDDGKRVGRGIEMLKLEEVIEQADIRTIAASPLEYSIKIEDVESFFCQYGKVNSVRLPRHIADKRCLCGTALIEFSTEEDAKNVLTQSLVYAGTKLELKSKKDFDAEREKLIEEFEQTRSSIGEDDNKDSQMNGSYPRGLILAFKLKPKSEDQSTAELGIDEKRENTDARKTEGLPSENDTAVAEEVTLEEGKDGKEKSSDDSEENKENDAKNHEKENTESAAADSVQKNEEKATEEKEGKSMTAKEVVTREDLKSVFHRFGNVKYVDFRMGEESGYIRFETPEGSLKARAMAALCDDGGLVVKNQVALLEPVTGDAERDYWNLLRDNQEKLQHKSNKGRGGKNNKGNRHHNRKHPRSKGVDSAEERPNKAQKIAAA